MHRALQFLYLQPTDFLLGGPFNTTLFKIIVDSPFFHFNKPLYSLREHPVFSAQVSSFTRREERFFSAGETRNLSRKNQMLSQASHYSPFPRSADVFPVICFFALLEGEKGGREICLRFTGLYSPGALKILDSQGLNRGVAGGFFFFLQFCPVRCKFRVSDHRLPRLTVCFTYGFHNMSKYREHMGGSLVLHSKGMMKETIFGKTLCTCTH